MRSGSPIDSAMLVSLLLVAGPAGAASVFGNVFRYDGGSPSFALTDGSTPPVQGSWDPRASGNPHVRDPGFHVAFFGHGDGCPAGQSNGNAGPLNPQQRAALVRTAPDAPAFGSAASVWAPLPAESDCAGSDQDTPGPTRVAIDPRLGIQLYTSVGDQPADARGFWSEFTSQGQNGEGTNRAIADTAVTWIFEWRRHQAIQPWPDGDGRRAVALASSQSIEGFAVAGSSGDKPNQVKQQYAVSFLNVPCLQTVPRPRTCQLRYLFSTAIMREPGTDWNSLRWSHYGILMFDPAQAGLPVFGGPLQEAGSDTLSNGADHVPLWHSNGAATGHGTCGVLRFEADIDFTELQTALTLIAQKSLGQQQQPDDTDMVSQFGPKWNDPASWFIVDVNAAQEVHSLDPRRQRNYLAGTIHDVDIVAGH